MGVLVRPFGVEDMADDEVDEQQRVCCCQQSPLGGRIFGRAFYVASIRVCPYLVVNLRGSRVLWKAAKLNNVSISGGGLAWHDFLRYIRVCRGYSAAEGCERR